MQHRHVEMTSDMTITYELINDGDDDDDDVIKMPFTDKDGQLTKAFQKEKRHCKSVAERIYE